MLAAVAGSGDARGKDYPEVKLGHQYVDSAAMLSCSGRGFDGCSRRICLATFSRIKLAALLGRWDCWRRRASEGRSDCMSRCMGRLRTLREGDSESSGAILSVAMMLRHSFQLERRRRVLRVRFRRCSWRALARRILAGKSNAAISTSEMGLLVLDAVKARARLRNTQSKTA